MIKLLKKKTKQRRNVSFNNVFYISDLSGNVNSLPLKKLLIAQQIKQLIEICLLQIKTSKI